MLPPLTNIYYIGVSKEREEDVINESNLKKEVIFD